MNLRLIVAGSLSAVLVAGTASAAQPWLSDRRYGEGIGLRAGNFEFHPSVAAEVGYDSNYFLRANTTDPNTIDSPAQTGGAGVVDAWRFRVTPSLTLQTLSERRRGGGDLEKTPMVQFQANTFASYSQLFGNQYLKDQHTWDFGIGGKADIASKRPLGADVYADFVRNGEPSNLPGTDHTFNRGEIRGGVGVTWRPGGGLFDWRLGYEAQYNYFEDEPYTALQNTQQSIVTRGRWRILPRSALIYDARYTFIRYTRNRSPQPNGDDLQARLGFTGLVTNRLSFLGLVGWNSTFYENGTASGTAAAAAQATIPRNYDGYVAQAELKYFVMPGPEGQGESAQTGLSSVAVGFIRDVNNSYLGSFYTRDRVYLGFDYFLGGVFVANVQGGYSLYSFPEINQYNASFNQGHVDATLFAEYRLSDTIGLNGTFIYDDAIGKGPNHQGVLIAPASAGPPATQALYDNLEYSRYQAYIGVRVFW
jgi:hypothetical protein